MVKDKIKALLNLTGKKQVEIAQGFGMSKESFNNKLRGERFTVHDLIRLAGLTGSRLIFTDKEGKKLIELDADDLKE